MASFLFLLAVLLGSLQLASGQLQELPKCGLDCIIGAVLNSTCSPTDTPCICGNAALQGHAQQCVVASCTVREQLTTLNITNAQCGIVSGHDKSWMPPMIFFIVLAGIIFVLRLVSRVVCRTNFWWDDFFNLLATIGCVGYSAVCFATGNLGLGTEIWAVPQENITPLLTLSYVEFLLYNWCEVTLRTSVLLFYIRVFPVGTGPRRIFWTVLIVSDILSVGFLLFNIFQCTPISYFWLRWDEQHEGRCINANKVTLSGGVIDLFWTLLILVIPLPYIWKLKLPPHKKFAATVMFAWGILTIAIMCYRFTTLEAYDVGQNATIDGVGVTLWSGLELDVALICACMPSIYPLFLRIIHRGRPPPPARPAPSSSVATIGGSGGKLSGRPKKRSLWSQPSMTGLTVTNSCEDPEDTSTKAPSGSYVELSEREIGSTRNSN
ncbi:CFEM domain-containing protein [Cercophora scortea]|uniref:CFEM domain-containing protein n=1 Tax=Cercophora scortea TaxID=314031 RepID=A0AAE0IG55_9PEZI|nr:CFEM domain-containing protein [Cercophora scortea]